MPCLRDGIRYIITEHMNEDMIYEGDLSYAI